VIRGLVLGKFYPLHNGHLALINFAAARCDELYVLLCASDKETIPGSIRLKWLKDTVAHDENIQPVLFNYSETDLPNTSIPSQEAATAWSNVIKQLVPAPDIFFSSEAYGELVAGYLNCIHISFDPHRLQNPINANVIRNHPLQHWKDIAPAARPYFTKKVCIYGTESTGKSTLTEQLAKHYRTEYVPEMAREIVEETNTVTIDNLVQIAELHANTIREKIQRANRFLFVDTDLNITRSYSKFLFDRELNVRSWVEEINQFDLYLYLDNDVPLVQDGSRLDETRRNELNEYHKRELSDRHIEYQLVSGNWEDRLHKAIAIINRVFELSDEQDLHSK
jgi:HTH-type transcriptional regulator, transcriptional repressor of NAD biosynthesis genes